MNRSPYIANLLVLFAIGLMSSCGIIQQSLGLKKPAAPVDDSALNRPSSFAWDSPRPEPALILSHVAQSLETYVSAVMKGDVRMRGQLVGSAEGTVIRARMDLRMRLENHEPVVWIAINDPLMGLPVGRLKITADSVHGFSPVLKQQASESIADISKWGVGVSLSARDLQLALMGLPVAMPPGACHVDQGADSWTLTFVAKREQETADITMVFDRGMNPRLRSQQIDAGGETLLIVYAPATTSSASFDAWTLDVPGRGQLVFKPDHVEIGVAQTFPYNLPSGYARMAL